MAGCVPAIHDSLLQKRCGWPRQESPCGFEDLGRIGTPQGGGPAKAIGSWRAPDDTIRLAKGMLACVAAVLTSTARLPTIFFSGEFAEVGGLMSYSPNVIDQFRQAGMYVGRILKGERPGDLPVMQPTKFEFVINLQTARTLGITVPPTVLGIADEVIERWPRSGQRVA